MATIAFACGEVAWERTVLEAVSHCSVELDVRRYVDAASIAADVMRVGAPPVIVMSPALRGFDPKPVLALAAAGVHVVVVLDTIRPPWVDQSGLDIRELAELRPAAFAEELALLSDRTVDEHPEDSSRGTVTVFAGVSGGVGTTSLAWNYGLSRSGSLLIDGHTDLPMLGFLAGVDATSSTLATDLSLLMSHANAGLGLAAPERVMTLPLEGCPTLSRRDAELILSAAVAQYVEVVVDVGRVGGSEFGDACRDRAQRLVLVATAAPSGVLRLPRALTDVRRDGLDVTVVINRLRESAAGSRHARTAIRDLVERSCGMTPTFVDDAPHLFDAAWLDGDWTAVRSVVPSLVA